MCDSRLLNFKMIFSDVLIYDLITVVTILSTSLVIYYKWSFTYWKRKGLECLEPSIPFGNTSMLFAGKYSFAEQFAEFYKRFKKKGLKHGGIYMFTRPFYIPIDPNIIKDITQKNFSHFFDRGFYVNEENDPLTGHLFSLEGLKWKNLRAKLSATFTSGRMKMMFETMLSTANELNNLMDKTSKGEKPMDIHEILARFTTDIITSCAFGIESNTLTHPNAPFRYYGKRIIENTTWENLKNFIQFMVHRKILDAVKFKTGKSDVEKFIMSVVKDVVSHREKNNIYRKDFLHLLLQLKNRGEITEDQNVLETGHKSEEIGLTMNELAAQVFAFFLGGYETSSNALTFAMYELSINQNIQDKLREEIVSVLEKHNKISYEAIMEMKYLDQVVNEALRKYPPLAFLNRICTKAYDVPNTNIHIEEGTNVVISMLGLHHDPEYYPEPERFDPDRFSVINISKRPAITWMPFGEGPRICIGLRFGLLQMKIGLVTMLKNYKVTLNEKTKMPLVMDKKALTLTCTSQIWLDVSKLNE